MSHQLASPGNGWAASRAKWSAQATKAKAREWFSENNKLDRSKDGPKQQGRPNRMQSLKQQQATFWKEAVEGLFIKASDNKTAVQALRKKRYI